MQMQMKHGVEGWLVKSEPRLSESSFLTDDSSDFFHMSNQIFILSSQVVDITYMSFGHN